MIRPPAFWWTSPPSLTARMLAPFAAIYGALTLRRMRKVGQRVGCPLVCIGNFTVGGAGKTPTAILIARMLLERGQTPVFLSRGYGGSLTGPVIVDPQGHGAAEVGDEPLLLARTAPVVVAADRVAGAALALRAGASVIIMDDGLQNPSLHKDLVVAVIDGGSGFGNGMVFPAGPLRAPVDGQAASVHLALVIGGADGRAAASLPQGLEVIEGEMRVPDEVAARIKGQRVLAMAGIGLPEKFVRTLEGCGATVTSRHFVADHAPYTTADLEHVASRAAAENALVATTEKDAARLGSSIPPALARRLLVVPVALEITSGHGLLASRLNELVAGRT
jgi:tetraacyldisaccharide 4'-kinase